MGSFVAGTSARDSLLATTFIFCGMLRADTGILSGMNLWPVGGGFIRSSTDLVTAMALDQVGLDSFIVGGMHLSDSDYTHAYLMRANGLFWKALYCVQYRRVGDSGDGRRLQVSDALYRPSVARGIVIVGQDLFMIVSHAISVGNATAMTILKTSAATGAIIKQVQVITPHNSSLDCTGIVAFESRLMLVCVYHKQALVLTVDNNLLFSQLPLGFMSVASNAFRAEYVPFDSTVVSVTSSTASVDTSKYEFATDQASYTRSPSVLPSPQPTSQPSSAPSGQPSSSPTASPTVSARPTSQPSTITPTITYKPTATPTATPTIKPSVAPSARPSTALVIAPSARPTARPSGQPLAKPSIPPSVLPSKEPSPAPSKRRTVLPTQRPSRTPSTSLAPTATPSNKSLATNKDGVSDVVYGSVGAGLGMLFLMYILFRIVQYKLATYARKVKRMEYYAQEAALIEEARAEMKEWVRREQERKQERRRAREERRIETEREEEESRQRDAQKEMESSDSSTIYSCSTRLSDVQSTRTPLFDALSDVTSSNYNVSSLHSSDMSMQEDLSQLESGEWYEEGEGSIERDSETA